MFVFRGAECRGPDSYSATMHFERTKKYTASYGSPRYSFRLVESRREGDEVRKRILLNLGASWCVPRKRRGDMHENG